MKAEFLVLLVFCLSAVLPGCQTAPQGAGPAPLAPGYSEKYSEEDEYSGRFLDYMRGRRPQASSGQSDSPVRQASATEPAIPRDLPGEELDFEDADEDDGFQLSDLAPAAIWENVKEAAGYGPNEQVARALFEEGEEFYRQKRYAEAAARFKAAASRWPDSPLAEDALFLAGESYFFIDKYPEANDSYSRVLEKYKHTRHLDRISARVFAIGRYWDQLHAVDPGWVFSIDPFDSSRPWIDPLGHALKAYESVRMNDPTGPLADDSLMATANALFTRNRYEEAANYYDTLSKHYAKSEHLLDASLLEMKSRLKMYQGPMYDGAPLAKAGETADQLLAQFPGQLGEHRDLVIRTKNQVVEKTAERDWAMAQYYENRKLYGAARFYYQAILKDYPQTLVAGHARSRLEQIRGLPDEPPNRFRWLTDMFGASGSEERPGDLLPTFE
jgi:outer membrane protein assembly factor BamD (BamD/ComL family)